MSVIFDKTGRFDERWISSRATRWLLLALLLVLIASAVTGISLRHNDRGSLPEVQKFGFAPSILRHASSA
jgi:hypothetical protein